MVRAVLVVLLIVLPFTVFAQTRPATPTLGVVPQDRVLRGLKQVSTEVLFDAGTLDDLIALRGVMRTTLNAEGIATPGGVGLPKLTLHIGSIEVRNVMGQRRATAIDCRLYLQQALPLSPNSGEMVAARTWQSQEAREIYVSGETSMVDQINKMLDQFVSDYRSVNMPAR